MTLPPIHYGKDYHQIEELALQIEASQPEVVGLDVEKTGSLVSLLQLATIDRCYLLQLIRVKDKIPPVVSRILARPDVVKVGVGLDHDAEELNRSYSLVIRSGLELQAIARTLKVSDVSLQGLAERFVPGFPGKNPLGHRGDWNADLETTQQYYAASDAYYSLLIYQGMMKISLTPVDHHPEESEKELFFIWVESYLKQLKNPIAFKSLLNYAVNSYSPWRKKYIKTERAEKISQLLLSFQDKLPYDLVRNKFLPITE